MPKILVIGNSFSENATFYLHQVAASVGIVTKVVNLFIGGCSMAQHWQNIIAGAHSYRYELNGYYNETSELVSIPDIIDSEKWDIVVFQQASHDSGILSSYEPFARNIFNYLQENAPQAKLFLHQTWSYGTASTHPGFAFYHHSQDEMYEKLTQCYQLIGGELNLPLIPTGEVVQAIRKLPFFVETPVIMNTDEHHLSDFYGKYLASLIWLKYVLKGDAQAVTYVPQNRYVENFVVDEEILERLKKFVASFSSTLV
ncbi:DUF4886 domain-containing protein [Enterococcus massiliensis]|uniref:DUF4886 domain-containing protein n=1 Tax=Enterococcus massiliensis TaxID=1640685 RepID=UPI00065E0181|nr:DUF4886 domain-containing protein [Enterococcus massiliensis]